MTAARGARPPSAGVRSFSTLPSKSPDAPLACSLQETSGAGQQRVNRDVRWRDHDVHHCSPPAPVRVGTFPRSAFQADWEARNGYGYTYWYGPESWFYHYSWESELKCWAKQLTNGYYYYEC